MYFWKTFWTMSLVVAGAAFAFVTLMVIVKGGKDLRQMFRDLARQQGNDGDKPT